MPHRNFQPGLPCSFLLLGSSEETKIFQPEEILGGS
jgi:hypothetical protein